MTTLFKHIPLSVWSMRGFDPSAERLLKACKESEVVRTLMGLPADIKRVDGSREKLNKVFEKLDVDQSGQVHQAEFFRVFNPEVARWLEETGVIAEPTQEEHKEQLRKLQRKQELRAADDATDFSREGPGRQVRGDPLVA